MPVLKTALTGGLHVPDENLLALHLVLDSSTAQNPVAGIYERKNDTLYFRPYAALGSGLLFEARLYRGNDTIRRAVLTPGQGPATAPLAEVTEIYPLGPRVPENILMFHVLFSEPMANDEMAFQKVKLLDEKGRVKERVWRERSYWTPDGKHLVLMVHPGRIKRGINYLEELGPVFVPGRNYTLLISDSLRDVHGRRAKRSHMVHYEITAADHGMPRVDEDRLTVPRSGTRDPLTLAFSERMDYGTLVSNMKVKDEAGNYIEGSIAKGSLESVWAFSPLNNWESKTYTLELGQETADLASNRLYKPFETKVLQEETNKVYRKVFRPE